MYDFLERIIVRLFIINLCCYFSPGIPKRLSVPWLISIDLFPESNDWNRGPTELVQHFACRGSSHRRKGVARQFTIGTVWLYRSPVPVGIRGVFIKFTWFLPALVTPKRGGGGRESAPCCVPAVHEARGSGGETAAPSWLPGPCLPLLHSALRTRAQAASWSSQN